MSVKYKEHKELNFAKVGEEMLAFWKHEKIFEKSVSNREGKQTFTFYEGPPSANGTPGINHVMARTVKDIFCRFKTLQGFQVNRHRIEIIILQILHTLHHHFGHRANCGPFNR